VDMPRRITPFHDLAALTQLLRHIRQVKPHIVHAHTPKGGLLGMIAAAIQGVPVRIYHMRGLPLLGSRGPRRLLLWLTERIACQCAHEVICVSESVRSAAIRSGIADAEKIRVLHRGSGNGVDARGRFNPALQGPAVRAESRARLGIPPEALVLGFVGRIVRDKGVVELARAWELLAAEYPRLHLLMVGPFEPQDPLPPATVALLRSHPRVHLAGEDWSPAPLYAAMDIVVLPTYREGFPNVPLEAAAMGIPVVATRVPGCTDAIIDGNTGTLVPPRDADALRAAVAAYLDDPVARERHGAAGRERVLRDFEPEAIWLAMFDVYRRLLASRRLPVPEPGPVVRAGPV
jgi:glycosyltransferase involved in cell wall biosynthesis